MKKLVIAAILLLGVLVYSCSDDDETVPSDDLVYISLEIEKNIIFAGDEVKVKANATGSNLNYYWSASKGDILGSGAEITYASSPCHIGTNQITCTITNGNQEKTKTVDVTVQE